MHIGVVIVSGGWVQTGRGCHGAFQGDEPAVYLGLGGSDMGVLSCTLQICTLCCLHTRL